MLVLPMASWWLYHSGTFSINSWSDWFLTAMVYAMVIVGCLLVYSVIFERKTLVMLLGYVKAVFRSKRKVKGND